MIVMGPRGVDRHERQGDGQAPDLAEGLGLRGQDDEPVDPVGEQAVQRRADRARVHVVEVRDVDSVPGLARSTVDGLQAGGRSVLETLAHQHPDGGGAAGHERTGGPVRTEVELVHGGQHAVPRLGPQARVSVEDPGHRLVRDAGAAGHVPDVRGAAGVCRPCPLPRGIWRAGCLSGSRQCCRSGRSAGFEVPAGTRGRRRPCGG